MTKEYKKGDIKTVSFLFYKNDKRRNDDTIDGIVKFVIEKIMVGSEAEKASFEPVSITLDLEDEEVISDIDGKKEVSKGISELKLRKK